MKQRVVVQKIHKSFSRLAKGEVYYGIISALNALKLTDREIQLLSFTNFRGSISAITAKNQFCALYGTTIPCVNNLISKLKKKNLLTKTGGKITVNTLLNIDLKEQTVLNINLSNAGEKTD